MEIIPTLKLNQIESHSSSFLEIKKNNNENSNLKLLDRYKINTPRASSRLQLSNILTQTRHYKVKRIFEWKNGFKKKKFEIYELLKDQILAFTEINSLFSNLIEVYNSKGLISELISNSEEGTFQMKLGIEKLLEIKIGAGRAIFVNFFEIDGIKPPYESLICPPGSCIDLHYAFGNRFVLPSIKNCKLCFNSEEIIAIRKVEKDLLEIDSKPNISFLTCFALSIFMFLS